MEAADGHWPDPDLLQGWLLRDRVPGGQVGAHLGLSRAAGYRWLQRYGIAAGTPAVSQEHLVTSWRSGTSIGELAAETGIPAEAVRDRLVAAAVMTPTRSYYVVGSTDDPLSEDDLRGWYRRDRFSVAQIAALTGLTLRQVRYRLTRYGLSSGRPGPVPKLQRRLSESVLTRLYQEEGLTCQQIGDRHDASAEAIRGLLAAYGISRRASGRRKRPAVSKSVRPMNPPTRADRHRLSLEQAKAAIAAARENVARSRRLMDRAQALCRQRGSHGSSRFSGSPSGELVGP